jgi:hypothetical protein
MSSGVPFGMVTPRHAIKELVAMKKRQPGNEFYVKRMRMIFKHLGKCSLPRCPVSLLDLPMRENEFEAVIKEAWSVVSQKDEIRDLIQDMAAQGNA